MKNSFCSFSFLFFLTLTGAKIAIFCQEDSSLPRKEGQECEELRYALSCLLGFLRPAGTLRCLVNLASLSPSVQSLYSERLRVEGVSDAEIPSAFLPWLTCQFPAPRQSPWPNQPLKDGPSLSSGWGWGKDCREPKEEEPCPPAGLVTCLSTCLCLEGGAVWELLLGSR